MTLMHSPKFDAAEAERLRREGEAAALRAERVQEWKRLADQWLIFSWESGDEIITADDLIAVVGLPDVGPNANNVVGAWFSQKSKQGYLKSTGQMVKSTRPERHGNRNMEWRINP